jgi:AraC-like DNA-binding protein
MQPILSTSTILYLISGFICLLAGVIIMMFSRRFKSHNTFLGLYFFGLGYTMMITFLIQSRIMSHLPFAYLYRTGNIVAYLIFPFSWFYLRSVVTQEPIQWKRDWIHLVPSLLFFIDYIPYYILPIEKKLEIIRLNLNSVTMGQSFNEGWLFPENIHVFFRTFLMAVYWGLQLHLLIKLIRNTDLSFKQENSNLLKWLWQHVILQSLFFLPLVVFVLFFYDAKYYFEVIHGFAALSAFVAVVTLLTKPELFYGIQGLLLMRSPQGISYPEQKDPIQENDIVRTLKEVPRPSPQYISAEKIVELEQRLEELLVKEKIYMNPALQLAELSIKAGVTPLVLSSYLNQVRNINFNDYINRYRVEACKEEIIRGGAVNKTLEGLAFEYGFNNRNTFTNAFKKVIGMTPSQFAANTKNEMVER